MKIRGVALVILWILAFQLRAQTPGRPVPYSFSLYQQLDASVYYHQSRFHSAVKPYFEDDSLIRERAAALLYPANDSIPRSWMARKIFREHLIDIRGLDHTIYADFLPDMMLGKDYSQNSSTWINSRGFQLGGTVGNRFSFYTSGFENQGRFPGYYERYIHSSWIVPGQSYDRALKREGSRDWSYVTALLTYTPVKYLNITAGHNKNFIGDGYRSMILSDFASGYPFLKLTGRVGSFQYMAMWASMQDPGAEKVSYEAGNRKKGGVFHYLDWNISNRLSVGLFDAVIWTQQDDLGNRRGFDWTYANPLIFLRPLEAENGSPDNALMGINLKCEAFRKGAVYGQFLLDEFQASNFFKRNGPSGNKWGVQAGIRGADLFGTNRLNYLLEFNASRPYTYTSRSRIISYSHYNEPLAHPFGANFRELVGKLQYSLGRFELNGQVNLAAYGSDLNQYTHFGKNIFLPYPNETRNNYIGQGVPTKMLYGDGRISFRLNPQSNLRIEAAGTYRREQNSVLNDRTYWLSVGIRSSFRNMYQDLSSISGLPVR
ncbi:MAG TPA: gliding motility protein RemB [Sphingobacteriaceae bacterium]